jgi:hypothetical protein
MNELAIELGGGLKGLPIGSSVGSVRVFSGSGHQPSKRSPDGYKADYWPDKACSRTTTRRTCWKL